MNVVQLIIELGIEGEERVNAAMKRTSKTVDDTTSSVNKTVRAFAQLEWPILGAVSATRSFISVAADVGRGLVALSGIPIAARFQRLEMGFTNILGSATQANSLLKELRSIGMNTEFNTEELTGFARVLLATGSNARSVTREIKALTDATAFTGLGTDVVGRLAINLSQIRNSPHPNRVDLKQFAYAGINLDRVVGAATGRSVATGQGLSQLQAMSGQQAFDTIITGFEKAFGGSAARNAGSLLGVIQNTFEAFQTIMLPTGRLLVPILTGIGTVVKTIAGGIGAVNELSGGLAGLIGFIGTMRIGWRLFGGAAKEAAGNVWGLARSLWALSAASKGAAGGTAAGAAAGGGFAGIRALISGGIAGLGAKFKGLAAGGIRGIGGKALGLLRGSNALGLLGLGIDLGGNFIGDQVGGSMGKWIKNLSTGVGFGMSIGSLGGARGAGAGAVVGLLWGIWKSLQPDESATTPQATEARQQTTLLREIARNTSTKVIGGDSRATSAVSALQIEYTLAKNLGLGFA